MEVQKSIIIAASPEEIWPFFVHPEKILQWYLTFQKVEYAGEQRSGVGTPIYIEEKATGPLMKMNFIFTEWKENELVTIRMEPGPGPKAYEQRWSIEPIPTGCKVTLWEEVQLPYGFIGKLLGLIGQRTSEATVEKILAKLKMLVEAEEAETVTALS
jgi:uncharacterized protein YndB with AHSA1/START domain